MLNTVNSILENHRVNSDYHTHVSMIQPTGKFQITKSSLDMFWNTYCDAVKNGIEFGIAEKPQTFIPLVVDIDIKLKFTEDKDLECLYTRHQVEMVVKDYQEVLRKVIKNCKPEHLIFLIFEKPAYRSTCGDVEMVKSGFHMQALNVIFSKDIHEAHFLPRIKATIDKSKTFENLGYAKSSDVIDECYTRNPWLLYGSKKSDNMRPYRLSYILNEDRDEIDLATALKTHKIFDASETEIDMSKNYEFYLPRVLSIIPWHRKPLDIVEGLPSMLKICAVKEKREFKELNLTEHLKKAKLLLDIISEERAVRWNDWMQIGYALYNVSEATQEGLELWLNFSSKCSEKYDEAVCISHWEKMEKRNVTMGTLIHFAKTDSPQGYNEIMNDVTKESIKSCITGSHYDIAQWLYSKFSSEFVCSSVVNNIWYQFQDHRWRPIEGGVFLKKKLSEDCVAVLTKMLLDLNAKMYLLQTSEAAASSDLPGLMIERKNLEKIVGNLKNSSFKASVMKECIEVFYNEHFQKLLDRNSWLIGAKNGIYDLKTNTFREGYPEDYISKQMPMDYTVYDESHELVRELYDFFGKVFTDKGIREYVLDVFADLFVGGNRRKKVHILSGCGDNAKSVFESMIEQMLGPDYAIKLPTALLVGKRTQSSVACPELARAGNGVRFAVVQEPDKRDHINNGLLKELSGNDTMYVRGLYSGGGEIKLDFTLFVVCLTGDTHITLSSGISIPINSFPLNGGYKVLSWDSKTNGLKSAKQLAFIEQGDKECVKLTLQDGREIECTPNHRFLTKSNEWIEAKDLKLGETELIMGVDAPKCDDIMEPCDYILDAKEFVFNMSDMDQRFKAMAFCRLLGYILTGGTQNIRFFLGHKIDVDSVLEDIFLLTGKTPNVGFMKNCIYVGAPNELMRAFSSLSEIQQGGRVRNKMILPDFVFDDKCPTFLIREFVGGLFGGDGIVSCLNRNSISPMNLIASKNEEHVGSLVEMFNKLGDVLLERFSIETKVLEPQPYEVKGRDDEKKYYNVFLNITAQKSIMSFCENIGFRYCCHKSYRMTAIATVIRHINAIVKRSNELFNIPKINRVCRKDKVSNLLQKYDNRSFFLETGLNHFMNQGKDAHYSVDSERTTLPTYTLKVISRQSVGVKPVYDLSIEDPYNNFLAEGTVTHNCNIPPSIEGDKATWNRIRIIPFESVFSDDAPETYEEQLALKTFPNDPYFSEKIPSLIKPLLWLLLNRRKNGLKFFEPQAVKMATDAYRVKNDSFKLFIRDRIVKEPTSTLNQEELIVAMYEYLKEEEPNKNPPEKQEIRDYFNMAWGPLNEDGGWKGYHVLSFDERQNNGNIFLIPK